jgi:hypothetical protein
MTKSKNRQWILHARNRRAGGPCSGTYFQPDGADASNLRDRLRHGLPGLGTCRGVAG